MENSSIAWTLKVRGELDLTALASKGRGCGRIFPGMNMAVSWRLPGGYPPWGYI